MKENTKILLGDVPHVLVKPPVNALAPTKAKKTAVTKLYKGG